MSTRNILERELSKAHLTGVIAAIADFTADHRATSEERLGRPVLVLQSERDRAFAGQAVEIRVAYPTAKVRIIRGAGHGALFTHTEQYVEEIQKFWQLRRAINLNRTPSTVFALLRYLSNGVGKRITVYGKTQGQARAKANALRKHLELRSAGQ